jgi:primosomal protein N' (replication factor Y)
MPLFLEVSFPDPIGDGTLTYHLPENKPIPLIGARAVAQVQHRRLIGYITGIHDRKPEFRTDAVGEILDPVPLFSAAMLKLAKHIAEDCVCNIGEVLHSMLPGGIKQTISRQIRLAQSDSPDLPVELAWLQKQDWVSYSSFQERFSLTSSQISSWLESGLLELCHSVSQISGPRFIKVIKLRPDTPIEPEKLTPKEALVIQALLRFSTAPTAAALAKAAQVSSAPVSQLKKKGLLLEEEERIMRQVATDDFYHRAQERIPDLSDDQQTVLAKIRQAFTSDQKPVLIRGVTCSGKTEVYLRWVSEILEKKLTAIVLVPEISLTPQMMKRFLDRFGPKVAILHSKLSDGERFDQWEKIRRGLCPVVVGARSAVFAPLPRLGTIILDEEGEPSFKQGESPRYHAREVARRRCEIENALLVMGSATPTIDSFYLCKTGDYHLTEMNSRVSDRKPPLVKVVDMRNELVTRKNGRFFRKLSEKPLPAHLTTKSRPFFSLIAVASAVLYSAANVAKP